jgi:hypothetical protein
MLTPFCFCAQILLFTSVIEYNSNLNKWTQDTMFTDPKREPGNLGFDPLRFGDKKASRARLEMAELKNGRLAMLAFSGEAIDNTLRRCLPDRILTSYDLYVEASRGAPRRREFRRASSQHRKPGRLRCSAGAQRARRPRMPGAALAAPPVTR